MLSQLLDRFKRYIHPHTAGQGIYTPILDVADIHELQNRAESVIHTTPYQREVEHRQYGDARSVYRGHGLDYEESRPYEPGDEMRFVNWRLSARTDKMYMKVFREERRPSLFVLMDKRAPMRFGSNRRLKVTQAARLNCLLACVSIEKNIPVSGVLLDTELDWLPECQGEVAIYSYIQSVAIPCPPLVESENEISLTHAIKLLQNILTRGSIIYLISDFHDLDDELTATLLQLSSEHSVTAINIIDQHEISLPVIGNINIHDPISNSDYSVDTSSAHVQRHYEALSNQHYKNIEDIFTRAGIDYLSIGCDNEDIEQVIPLP